MKPLVPEYAPTAVKVVLLPVTLPLAVVLILAESLAEIATRTWTVLRGR